ncbi:MAG TPA: AAA family ATPase [Burkholderiales bacterium]|nr:AAA family ATPase [Burkholderiales bacterium]
MAPSPASRAVQRRNGAVSLATRLLDPACYPHPVGRIRIVETHISWVLLTGEYAYKIKKPVDLGFVDFSTLRKRRAACIAELKLNRRLAPDLYLEVVEIRGDALAPHVGGDGPVLDYAVRMREFPQADLASRALARGKFGAAEIDRLATRIAEFHARAGAATGADRLGTPATVRAAALQNFEQMRPGVKLARDARTLQALRRWTEREFALLEDTLAARKRDGLVRECHGDLHLGNIVLIGGAPVPFDCIEFDDALRWIDVMSEMAFAVMDLEDRRRPDLAWRLLNRYLESTGGYAGVRVLRFYLVYRALVRAKVHLMRSRQRGLARSDQARLLRAFHAYLALAQRFATAGHAGIVITHGLSGCGKTTFTQALLQALGALRVRSDLERKRLHRLPPLARSRSTVAGGIYTARADAATYRRLAELAGTIAQAGFPAVVDATFLTRSEREAFRAVADALDVPFVILNMEAPLALLRERLRARSTRTDDASEAGLVVLEHQLAAREPLTPAEMAASIRVDASRAPAPETLRAVARRLLPPTPRRPRAPRRRGQAAAARGRSSL